MTGDRMASEITLARTDAEILATRELIVQLHSHLGQVQPVEYLRRVRLQQEEIGYQLAVLRHAGEIVSVAGFRFCRSLGWGTYLYLDDLVTAEGRRSRGAGKVMFAWLVEKARAAQCDLRLDCAFHRQGAHRFYLRERMEIACFHFRLSLNKLDA